MNKSLEEIYEKMKVLIKEAVGDDIFFDVIGQFIKTSNVGKKTPFQLYIESKLSQLKRRNKIVSNNNALIEKYGHVNESKALNIQETEGNLELALSAYCIISLCIHGWKHHQVSTNQTVTCLVKVFDYIKNPQGDDSEMKFCSTLAKYLDSVFWSTELPFLPNQEYGRFFICYPDHSVDIWNSSEENNVNIDKKRERAIFLMLYFELHGSMRPRYSRECERIRSSVFFRYSQYKAQVMFNSASDEQRTRLSHSLEVAGVAKTIAIQLGCNWELVEAMALGHDLGHVPFGHQGEEQLDECLHNAWAGRFSHSLQSVKVLNELANHSSLYDRFGVTGLCLSRPVLEGILKHDTENLLNDIRRAGWRLQYNGWREALLKYDKKGNKIEAEWVNGVTMGGLESQIVYWADKIAYAGHDWDELAQSGYIDQLAISLDSLFKRMHQVTHMLFGSSGSKRTQVNYSTVTEEIGIIRFIRFIAEEIRELLVTDRSGATSVSKPKNDTNENNKQDKIENRIFRAFHPWDNGSEEGHPSNPIETYKDYHLHHLIRGLDYILKEKIEPTDSSKKLDLKYLTKAEYKQLFDFFSVVYYWVKITGIYPKPYKKSDDFISVLCRYLTNIDNRIVVQALQIHLIQHSRKNIINAENVCNNLDELDEARILNICQDKFNNESIVGLVDLPDIKTLKDLRDYVGKRGYIDSSNPENKNKNKIIKQYFKKYFQKQMIISMDSETIEALGKTNDFVHAYYIENPRVRAMKLKAHKIIKQLFDFYMEHGDMLPIEYQQRMEYDAQNLLKTYDTDARTHYLAFQYLRERCLESRVQDDDKAALSESKTYNSVSDLINALKNLRQKNEKNYMPQKLVDFIDGWENISKTDGAENKFHFALCRHITKARVVADYIACMTDRMAAKKYNEIVSSSTTWSTSFQE